mgnify:CR=1 FL=1
MRQVAKCECARWPNSLRPNNFDFEALRYDFYPYKKEIDTYLSKRKKIDKKIPIKRKYPKKLSKKEKVNLHKYFWNLESKEPNIIDLGEVNI